ncbi:hypothetical protein E4T38_05717 [Aureobasidium subglaciale]|nr:hypothetical protein E4T38_05717 [Aureobasidium subglaciale]KAI5221134.1 hypothetical protein E4T40_05645 [Aureobasidium subglaciale]KAI5224399.1 hypothetical protein E4T41_05696 [Aureobasidium subglaciale]KAI5261022.1 hypothetical protein E4T46_05471 [Aureobasidium subglaciale]
MPPHDYNIPDPPLAIPSGLAENFVARLNPVTNQFRIQSRRFGLDSQLNYASMDDPPTEQRDLKLGPPIMDAAGFVNSTAYRTESQMPSGRLDTDYIIHPVLMEDMWHGLQPGEYTLMEPALRLASAILDDPDTSCFFAGLTVPSRSVPWLHVPYIGKCAAFRPSDPLDHVAQTAVYERLTNMRSYMVWSMQDIKTVASDFEAFGVNVPWSDNENKVALGANGVGTRSSVIYISRGYTDAMRMFLDNHPTQPKIGRYINDTQYLAGIPLEDNIHLDEHSAITRSTLLFADTLIHEFAHAVCGAYFEVSAMAIPGDVPYNHIFEPFFAGDRSNEVGHAISSYIWRGNPAAMMYCRVPKSLSSRWMQQHIGPLGLY